ncbi:MAG TPA: tryptophan synthase subunit alpha [Candidatus Limnocylindria bacterium]|nr:tryptophan synthase subunit alpha [Candidatus Limnocylindria bacterium]
MNKFKEKFSALSVKNKIAFMPFVIAGFPNFKKSLKIAATLCKTADFLEIGFPYSDPLADGPVIQQADLVALQNGLTTKKAFEFVKKIRTSTKIPFTIMVYANVVYQAGIESFYRQAKKAGADAVLVPDAPLEEMAPFIKAAKKAGILPIFLVTQTTTNQRLAKILKFAEGFLYVVSILGVTGDKQTFSAQTFNLIRRIKSQIKLPLAVGFGISKKEQVVKLKKAGANGVIVGSALIKIVNEFKNNNDLYSKLINYGKELTG